MCATYAAAVGRESYRLLNMGEVVSSAVVHETVNKIISGLIDKYEQNSSAEEQMERLEMAHIKLETALETSSKWQITGGPLQLWQKKLKRAAEECDDTLRKCRQRVQEEEQAEQQVKNSSLPTRIAHATKSLISSIFHGNIDEPIRSAVRRFEWFADGANDFLRSVEFGGTPRRYLFFDPLIGRLLAGETLEYKLVQGNKQHLFWIRPNNTAERGVEAKLIFVYNDGSAPVDNFFLGMMLQLSECTNIVGTAIKCLQLFAPHFKSTTETVRKELSQLPTQDFSWVPRSRSYHWDSIHSTVTEWFRPNPMCCKHRSQKVCSSGNMEKTFLPDISLESIIDVSLQCQVSLAGLKDQVTVVESKPSLKEFPHLKVHLVYTPHGSSEDLFPAVESSVIEMVNGVDQHCLHTNIALEQMEGIMLPRAVDCFRQNAGTTVYQMVWKSKHGGAYLQAVKVSKNMLRQRTIRGAKKAKLLRRHDHWTQSRIDAISDFFNLWAAHAPVQLQGSILDWTQKDKEAQGSNILARGSDLGSYLQRSGNNQVAPYVVARAATRRGRKKSACLLAAAAARACALARGRESYRLLKMGEVVSSALVHETVNKIISGMIDKYERKSSAQEQMDRLEMAQIKLDIALETSKKWQITSEPLLRWQKKLKRVAEECDDTIRMCRQRVQEEQEAKQVARDSFFPRRIAHATKSLISSIFYGNIDEPTRSTVRRFEWFADGANDFLRSVESGGTPRRYLFFDPLIGHLLAGEMLEYKLVQGNKQHLFWIRPNNIAERGVEGMVFFVYNDGTAPEDNFFLGMILQLSESTNIVGTIIKCLQLFAPHFESVTETVRKELTLLPTQDFSWIPHSRLYHWDSLHSIATEWFRPNPVCCKHHDQKVCGSGNMNKIELQDFSLESVIQVNLQCHVALPGFRERGTIVEGKSSLKEFLRGPSLNVLLAYTPHGSSESLFPSVEGSVIEVINANEQHCLHTNIALQQMEEIMLPRAIDYFHQNAKATVYQMLWKPKHGVAYLHAVKATVNILSTRRTIRGARKSKLLRQQDHKMHHRTDGISDFLSLWAAHAPVQLQGSILDWVQKEKEVQLAAPLLRLKF
uniref:Disease resistance N-terminal domain-containing protein n=2 Tax=Oryza glumipatula TaxID=40148 RepID=A0A0E0AFB0_9ORYZ